MSHFCSRMGQQPNVLPFAFRAAPEPLPFEPAHGWVRRAALMNGQPSMPTFAAQYGIDGISTDPQVWLSLALASDIPNPQTLALNTPMVGQATVSVRGEDFRAVNWSCRHRRVCPACLHQSAHHRFFWDFRFFLTCPFHGLPLEGGTRENPIRWSQTDLRLGADGLWLPRESPMLQAPRPSLETYALGRLGVLEKTHAPLLDATSLDDGARAVATLAPVLSGRDQRRISEVWPYFDAASQDAAYEALSGDHAHLVAVLQQKADAALSGLPPRAAASFATLFGRLPPYFYSEERIPGLFETVRLAMRSVAIATGRVKFKGAASTVRSSKAGLLRQGDLARETGLPSSALWRLLEWCNVRNSATGLFPDYYLNEDLEAVKAIIASAMTPEEAAIALGLKVRNLGPLTEAGLLRTFYLPNDGGRKLRRFHRSDVEAIVGCFADDGDPAVATISFNAMMLKLGISKGELARRVIAKEVAPAGRIGKGRCFYGMRLETPTSQGAAPAGISIRRASLILQVPVSVVRWLCKFGHLPHSTGPKGPCGISLEATIRMADDYVPTSVLAPRLGLASGRLAAAFLDAQCATVLRPGVLCVGLVLRSDVAALDPKLLALTHADVVWKELRESCASSRPAWDLPRLASGDRVWFEIAGRKICAKLIIDARLTLVVDCTAENACRRLRILKPLLGDLAVRLPGFTAAGDESSGVTLTSEFALPDDGTVGQEAVDWFDSRLSSLKGIFSPRSAGRAPKSDEMQRAEAFRRRLSGAKLRTRTAKARKYAGLAAVSPADSGLEQD